MSMVLDGTEHCGSYAMPLMLQAVSILIPPAPQESSPEDKCRGQSLLSYAYTKHQINFYYRRSNHDKYF